jgi:hypothetical protein
MPAVIEKLYSHRDAVKILEHAAPTGPPPHAAFAVANGRVKPVHQTTQFMGHLRTIRVTQESATPTSAFASSEQFSVFVLPKVEGSLDEMLFEVSYTYKHTTGSSKVTRQHPSYSLIDRVEVFLDGGNTASEIISGETMALEWIFVDPVVDKEITSHEYGYTNEINGRVRSADLIAEATLASATSVSVKRTFPLRTCLSHARLSTAFIDNEIKIRVYWSGVAPVSVENGTGVSGTLVDANLICTESMFDSDTSATIAKLYGSSAGVHIDTIARSESEHTQPSGATGSEQTETLNQHTSYCAAAVVFWRDSSIGLTVGSTANTMRVFPHTVVHGSSLDNGTYLLEDEQNKQVIRRDTHAYHKAYGYNHCNFQGQRSGYTGFVWIPHSFDVQSALQHGARTGGLAYSDQGRWKFIYERSTAHNSSTTQTLVYTSFAYATLRVANGHATLTRL